MNASVPPFLKNHIEALSDFTIFFQKVSYRYVFESSYDIDSLMEKSLSHNGQIKISFYFLGAMNHLVDKYNISFNPMLEDGTTGYDMLLSLVCTQIDKIANASSTQGSGNIAPPILLSPIFKDVVPKKKDNENYLTEHDHILKLGFVNCRLFFDGYDEISNASGKSYHVDLDYAHPRYIEEFIFNQ